MTEPTLLQQARHEIGLAYQRLGDMVPGGLCETLAAVERLLWHIEQQQAAMREPAQVPTASTLQRYTSAAQVPSEPKCKVCGDTEEQHVFSSRCRAFESGSEPKCKVCGETKEHWRHAVLRKPVSHEHHDFAPIGPKCSYRMAVERGADGFATLVAKPEPSPAEALDLDELQRLCDAATPGPWNVLLFELARAQWGAYEPTTEQHNADMRLVDAARDALPKLIARVRELENPMWIAAARRNAICPDCNAKRDRTMCGDCRRRFPEAEHG